ncbi:MAG: RidA family protein, partial [bacterium]
IFNFDLSETERSAIADTLDVFGMVPGDCGDEYRTPPFLTASGDLSDHFEDTPTPYVKKKLSAKRAVVTSGTSWEDIGGYSRAIRIGDQIWVSGTTATHGPRNIGGSDPESQAHFIIDKIEGALISLGGCLQDVIRTRIYLRDISDWEVVARVHGKRFGDIAPVNTLVQAGLVGKDYLVEIEADAVVEEN